MKLSQNYHLKTLFALILQEFQNNYFRKSSPKRETEKIFYKKPYNITIYLSKHFLQRASLYLSKAL